MEVKQTRRRGRTVISDRTLLDRCPNGTEEKGIEIVTEISDLLSIDYKSSMTNTYNSSYYIIIFGPLHIHITLESAILVMIRSTLFSPLLSL